MFNIIIFCDQSFDKSTASSILSEALSFIQSGALNQKKNLK